MPRAICIRPWEDAPEPKSYSCRTTTCLKLKGSVKKIQNQSAIFPTPRESQGLFVRACHRPWESQHLLRATLRQFVEVSVNWHTQTDGWRVYEYVDVRRWSTIAFNKIKICVAKYKKSFVDHNLIILHFMAKSESTCISGVQLLSTSHLVEQICIYCIPQDNLCKTRQSYVTAINKHINK